MKRCALCGGRLGLISHRKGIFRFCKLAHKSAHIECEREQQKAEQRRKLWSDFLSRRSG
jgi:ssDNA-binding Zn-finger/Zn-ribbon topoisomerase 1